MLRRWRATHASPLRSRFGGGEAQNAARAVVGGDKERTVRSLAHVADALVQLRQQALFLEHLLAVELEPHQNLTCKRPDKQVAAPRRKQIAGVKRHSGGRDGRNPVPDWLLHSLLVGALVNLCAVVVDAVADHRPAVVLTLLNDV